MVSKFIGLITLGAIAFIASPRGVQAQDPSLGYLYASGSGYSSFHRYHYNVPTPPYFALHPPVYYGERYERPYGVSPFAAGPQMQLNADYRPRLKEVDQVTVINPHASARNSSATPQAALVAPVAMEHTVTILNPYATQRSGNQMASANKSQ